MGNIIETMELRAKPIVKEISRDLKETLGSIEETPVLKILRVGNDPASEFYVSNLLKKSKKNGIDSEVLQFDEKMAAENFYNEIRKLNDDENIHGIMVQKPLPSQINDLYVSEIINPEKDVDGFNPVNLGKLLLGEEALIPCTPAAVIEILKHYQIETNGKKVVIIGRSNIVGKPLANLLLRKDKTGNATVTVCHSRTQNIEEISKEADILIAAIGKAGFVKESFLKNGSIVIDVGINEIVDSNNQRKYVGDVDFSGCFEKASAITPVPGGVGSITTILLLRNVLKAFLKTKEIKKI